MNWEHQWLLAMMILSTSGAVLFCRAALKPVTVSRLRVSVKQNFAEHRDS